MTRVFKAGPSAHYQWPGRCTVDSNNEGRYIYHRTWPVLSKHKSVFTIPLHMLLSDHMWEEDDPDLMVAEGL